MPDVPQRDFEAAYRDGTAPWEIGRPQPEVVRLLDDGELVGDVLDVGCGTGENALLLASRGRRVLGVDASPAAVERAREKAAARGLAVPFVVADALHLEGLRRRFETALDSGLFHVFGRDDRRAYARSLGEVLASGAALHVICFSDEEPPGPGPNRISEADLGDAFRSLFVLTRLRPGRYETNVHPGGARAWVATLVKI
jgi:SAM-dependent methyltransferase